MEDHMDSRDHAHADGGRRVEGFTPGPWLAAAGPSSIVGWPVVARPTGRSICSVSWLPGLPDELVAEIHANARLIAAAPDLLAALRGVIAVADRKTVEFDAARAAIAKALAPPTAGTTEAAGEQG